MVFSINEFKSIVNKYGLQRENHFAVHITPPAGIDAPDIIHDFPLLCDSANLPGFQFATDDIKHKGYGLTEKRPGAVSYDDLILTVIADGQGKVLDMFNQWSELIFPTNDERTDAAQLELIEYPENYYGTIEVYVYDCTSKKIMTITYNQAWPVNMNGHTMSWDATNTIMKIPVNFTYRSFKKNSKNEGESPFSSTLPAANVQQTVVNNTNPIINA